MILGRCSGTADIVQYRHPRAEESITSASRCCWPAAITRGRDAVGVQAAGHDPVRTSKAARTAYDVADVAVATLKDLLFPN